MNTIRILTLFTIFSLPAAAEDMHGHHQHQSPNDIYAPAMDRMMKDMPAATGSADADFMRQMIVHHQAAIDMATIALQKAQNHEVRALADAILTAQKSEIAYMREWLRVRDLTDK